ncbi:hypothetical protein FRC04_010972 [Tulasnella sp. 424]|nr:hypothetical protein FRC04_010972 [Tulasnella sp. 424]KAG8972134.1 hypothetical protein FRC05_010302 [Tulasnella sp. 425]
MSQSTSTSTGSWEPREDDEQLDQNVFEIDPDRSFHTFLGGVPGASVQACLDALKDPNSASFQNTINSQVQAELQALNGEHHPDRDGFEAIWAATLGRLPTYNQAKRQFDQLVAGVEYEADLCEPLASLLTFINHFYRQTLGNIDGVDKIDKEWLEATQTWPPVNAGRDGASSTECGPSRSQAEPRLNLRRRFAVVPDKVPQYTRKQGMDFFRPDLALVLLPSEDPWLPNPLGWKDIKVSIRVKRSIETPHIQTAQYAHCMKFDRNFLFTLSITENEFRISRWDSTVFYVTPSINYHEDPSSFIHVVGRLACMSPAQLGYDETFSNAGRVLHSQSAQSNRGIRTTLTITPCEVVEDLRESSHTAIKEPVRYLLDDNFLCESCDLLFSRSTRVWKAQLITESGPSPIYNAIKQNWHDEDRVNEAWFYEQTKDIARGAAHMIHFEDLDRTRGVSSMIESRHVLATWTRGSTTKTILERKQYEGNASALDNLCHRVLVWFVLEEVGLPLSRIKTPRQLVHVFRDIAIALEALYDRNILHRDISEGNILLYADEDAVQGNLAFLTDFGLAMKIDPNTKLPLPSSVKHDHITGTLPFIATIFHSVNEPYTPLSMIHHDVESLFLVGIYTVFKFASCEGSENMSEKEEGEIAMCNKGLALLRSSDDEILYLRKQTLLSFKTDVKFPGRWFSIRDFLSNVAFVCDARFQVAREKLAANADPDPLNHDLRAVVSAADAVLNGDSSAGLDAPAPTPLPLPSSRSTSQPPVQSEGATSTSATSKGTRRWDDGNASYQGRRDNLSGTRERSKWSRKGASSEADQEL